MQKAESNKMKNIFIITKREFLTQVKKKSFIILTLLAPILLIGFGALIAFMLKANETEYSFNGIDKSGVFQQNMKTPKDVKLIYLPESTEQALTTTLPEMVDNVDGLLIIPKLQDQNFENLQKQTQLLVTKNHNLLKKCKNNNFLTQSLLRTKESHYHQLLRQKRNLQQKQRKTLH